MLTDIFKFTGEPFSKERKFWKVKLDASADPFLLRPNTDDVLPRHNRFNTQSFAIGGKLSALLMKYSNARPIELNLLLLTALFIVLRKYSTGKRIIVNTPRLAQSVNPEVRVKKVVLSHDVEGSQSLRELLPKVSGEVIEAYQNQNFPVFDFFENNAFLKSGASNVLYWGKQIHEECPKEVLREHDMVLIASVRGPAIDVKLLFRNDVIPSWFAGNFVQHFLHVVRCFESLETKIRDIVIFTPEEIDKLLVQNNSNKFDYPREKTVVAAFEEISAKDPHRIAISYNESALTYSELKKRSADLKAYLCTHYPGDTHSVVAICTSDLLLTTIAMIGVMQAGKIYLPINQEYSAENIMQVVGDSAATLVIGTGEKFESLGQKASINTIDLNDPSWREPSGQPVLEPTLSPDAPAYLIFTSGSTGVSKGVVVSHRSLANIVLYHVYVLGMDASTKYLQFMATSFDGSILDIFSTLLSGGTLTLVDRHLLYDSHRFMNYVEEKQVNMITITPSYLSILEKRRAAKIATIISAGEAANLSDAMYYAGQTNFYNGYGPSEGAINSTLFKVSHSEAKKQVSIGRPSGNIQVYILDENNQLKPEGCTGEICISGVGLALGYLNSPELTDMQFVPNPFDASQRIYKTGDMGSWLPDGNILYEGRSDGMVKLRGYRISLQEVENCIGLFKGIRNVSVDISENAEGSCMVACYTENSPFPVSELRAFLQGRLPSYMIPAYFIRVDSFPVTLHGKVNKKALFSGVFGKMETVGENASSNYDELRLVKLCREILNHPVNLSDNFFSQGGDSLKATRLIAKIVEEWNIEIDLATLLQKKTLSELLSAIHHAKSDSHLNIPRLEERNTYDVSRLQLTFWLKAQHPDISSTDALPILFSWDFSIDVKILRQALMLLIHRHEIMRTIFVEESGVPKQKVLDISDCEISIAEYTVDDSSVDQLNSLFNTRFQLDRFPLFKAHLLTINQQQVMAFFIHHIITDGWSLEILRKELVAIYESIKQNAIVKFDVLTFDFKDYVDWHARWRESAQGKKAKQFWISKLQGGYKARLFHHIAGRKNEQRSSGKLDFFKIPLEHVGRLSDIATKNESTLYTVLITILFATLNRLTGRNDIIVGSPVSGRFNAELYNKVGPYMNVMPIRETVQPLDSFVVLLNKIKKTVIESFAYQHYPYDMVMEELKMQNALVIDLPFEVGFTFQNQFEYPKDLLNPNSKLLSHFFEEYKNNLRTSANAVFWLVAYHDAAGAIEFVAEYDTGYLSAAEISILMDGYQKIIHLISKDIAIPVSDLKVEPWTVREPVSQVKEFKF